jgi:Cu+-exporting ATPase
MRIEGMHCGSCVARIEGALSQVPGVTSASVNLATGQGVVSGSASPESLLTTVRNLGYQAEALTPDQPAVIEDADTQASQRMERLNLVLASLLTLPLVVLAMSMVEFPGVYWVQWALATPVVLWCGRSFFIQAWQATLQRTSTMDTLVALGAGAAYFYGTAVVLLGIPGEGVYFETAAVIVTLILLGRYLESRARAQAQAAINQLMRLQPQVALVSRSGPAGPFAETPLAQVQSGDFIRLRPGEIVPVDGTVVDGESALNESLLTGESLPVDKHPDDALMAGTLNETGSLVFRAERVGAETSLARMIRLMESAQRTKPPIQRLADTVAGRFVPFVLFIAALTFVLWWQDGATVAEAIRPTLAVLVIACPCAMGLATPTAIQVATGRSAGLGFFIRNVANLEQIARLNRLVLDKTGTLTEGHPQLVAIAPPQGMSEADFLALSARLEALSEHPLARAVVSAAEKQGLLVETPVQDFQATAGQGVRGIVAGQTVFIGRLQYIQPSWPDVEAAAQQLHTRYPEADAPERTVLYVAILPAAGAPQLGALALADTLRPGAKEAVARLKAMGIEPVMLTGDRASVAEAMAAQTGIASVAAQLMPEEKLARIQALQQEGYRVGMVGDGINDAPALAQAHVGFAMGTGTDVAMESADVTLVRPDIGTVAEAILLSRVTLRIIRQNLFWAFIYNALSIPVAALGWLNPMLAAGAMALSSVSVVTNSLRLRKIKLG